MLYLLSTAHSACAHTLSPSLRYSKLASRMCVLSFNRTIALYMVFLHALVLINTLSELDRLVDLTDTHATLTVLSLVIPPLTRHFLRLVMGPAHAVAPSSTHEGKRVTLNKTLDGPPLGTLPIPTGPTAQRLSEPVSGEAGLHYNSEQWNYQPVLWSGPETGESVATATFASPYRGSTPGEPFHGKGERMGPGDPELKLILPTNTDFKLNAQVTYPRKGPAPPSSRRKSALRWSYGAREKEADPQLVSAGSQATMSPLGGWSVGISTIVAMAAYSTVQWILTAFRRYTRPTRSALAALSGALLTRSV